MKYEHGALAGWRQCGELQSPAAPRRDRRDGGWKARALSGKVLTMTFLGCVILGQPDVASSKQPTAHSAPAPDAAKKHAEKDRKAAKKAAKKAAPKMDCSSKEDVEKLQRMVDDLQKKLGAR